MIKGVFEEFVKYCIENNDIKKTKTFNDFLKEELNFKEEELKNFIPKFLPFYYLEKKIDIEQLYKILELDDLKNKTCKKFLCIKENEKGSIKIKIGDTELIEFEFLDISLEELRKSIQNF